MALCFELMGAENVPGFEPISATSNLFPLYGSCTLMTDQEFPESVSNHACQLRFAFVFRSLKWVSHEDASKRPGTTGASSTDRAGFHFAGNASRRSSVPKIPEPPYLPAREMLFPPAIASRPKATT